MNPSSWSIIRFHCSVLIETQVYKVKKKRKDMKIIKIIRAPFESEIRNIIFLMIVALILICTGFITVSEGCLHPFKFCLIEIIGASILFFSLLYIISEFSKDIKKSVFLTLTYLSLTFFFLLFIIFSFTWGYVWAGIVDSSETEVVIEDVTTCFYFSVVTFTTLGYGDYHPTSAARGIAAFEALFGYICMGILIGVIVFLLTRKELA